MCLCGILFSFDWSRRASAEWSINYPHFVLRGFRVCDDTAAETRNVFEFAFWLFAVGLPSMRVQPRSGEKLQTGFSGSEVLYLSIQKLYSLRDWFVWLDECKSCFVANDPWFRHSTWAPVWEKMEKWKYLFISKSVKPADDRPLCKWENKNSRECQMRVVSENGPICMEERTRIFVSQAWGYSHLRTKCNFLQEQTCVSLGNWHMQSALQLPEQSKTSWWPKTRLFTLLCYSSSSSKNAWSFWDEQTWNLKLFERCVCVCAKNLKAQLCLLVCLSTFSLEKWAMLVRWNKVKKNMQEHAERIPIENERSLFWIWAEFSCFYFPALKPMAKELVHQAVEEATQHVGPGRN